MYSTLKFLNEIGFCYHVTLRWLQSLPLLALTQVNRRVTPMQCDQIWRFIGLWATF